MTKTKNEPWRGYTLDELRYRRAYTEANTQVQRMMLTKQVADLRRGNPVTRGWSTLRDILSAVGYVKSALLALRVFKSIRGLRKNLRR